MFIHWIFYRLQATPTHEFDYTFICVAVRLSLFIVDDEKQSKKNITTLLEIKIINRKQKYKAK